MDSYKLLIEKLQSLNNDRHEKFNSWLRNIITIASGLIVVLVSLKNKKSADSTTHIFFVLTISLFANGIALGLLALYHQVIVLDKAQACLQKYISEWCQNEGKEDLLEFVDDHKLYKPVLIICLCSFLLGLVSLVFYAYLIDK